MSLNNLQHIAFIMDGNRRWAVKRGLPKMKGHTEGLENFKHIVDYCGELNIPYITFWALSTDNLKKRSKPELTHLFKLLGEIRGHLKDFIENDARIEYIGDLTKLPAWLRAILKDVKEKTKNHKKIVVTLAINYGGKDEIVRMAKEVTQQTSSKSQVTEANIDKIIDSGFLPPVDLLIRTGGQKRLSGFLPWIVGYAEIYFVDTMWPAFKKKQLMTAIEWYNEQKRNFGA